MQKSVNKKSKKSCVLTDSGRTKLENALKSLPKEYIKSDGSYNLLKIAKAARVDRTTLGKVLGLEGLQPVNECEPVLHKILEDLFKFFSNPTDTDGIEIDYDCSCDKDLDLDDSDYKEADTQGKSPSRKQSKNKDDKARVFEEALRKLNYLEQKQLFERAINESIPARTFFIHGEPFYGQRWLVNILAHKVPYCSNAWKLPIRITPTRKGIENLWNTLADKLSTSASPQAISNKLYEQWRTSTVILVIHNVNLIAGNNTLPVFMENLWKPLVDRVNSTDEINKNYRLLLFLVDDTNSKSNFERLPCLTQSLDRNQSQIHLEFLEIRPFNENEIKTWVGLKHELLSKLWSAPKSPIEETILETLEGTHTPISVLTKICECFDFNWEQDIAAKLAL